MGWYRRAVLFLSALFVVIGIALLAVAAAGTKGAAGYVLGALFMALGVARITVEARRDRVRGEAQTRQ